jgi:cell division protein FtsQ
VAEGEGRTVAVGTTPPGPVVPVDDRIAERRRQVRADRRRRRLRRTITVAVLLVLLSVAVLVEPLGPDDLDLGQGDQRAALDEDVVIETADLPIGTSTLRLRLGAVEDRVRALPLVADVEATRLDPLTVRLTVTERTPVLVLVAGDSGRLVDADGVVLAAGVEEALLPVALPAGVALPPPGGELPAGAVEAVAVVTGLSGPLLADVVSVEVTGDGEVDLLRRDGIRVRMGSADRLDEKLRALGAVLEDLRDTEVAVIDVRAPSTPSVSR